MEDFIDNFMTLFASFYLNLATLFVVQLRCYHNALYIIVATRSKVIGDAIGSRSKILWFTVWSPLSTSGRGHYFVINISDVKFKNVSVTLILYLNLAFNNICNK